eukprot:14209014-Alexandrium_andersonii.AAC.1
MGTPAPLSVRLGPASPRVHIAVGAAKCGGSNLEGGGRSGRSGGRWRCLSLGGGRRRSVRLASNLE